MFVSTERILIVELCGVFAVTRIVVEAAERNRHREVEYVALHIVYRNRRVAVVESIGNHEPVTGIIECMLIGGIRLGGGKGK